jgi:AraC-like DNA-binding protein
MVLVRPLAVALERVPGALAAFHRATDLTPQMLADVEARVSPSQFCVAWAEAARLSGDPTLALRIAEATPQGAFGIVEYVCRSAPTLRGALERWVRYLRILDDAVEVALVDEGRTTSLKVITESEAPAPASHELCFALVVQNARAMAAGALEVIEVRYPHRLSEAQAARHRAFFKAPVRSGAKSCELVLDARALSMPLTTADPNLSAILTPAAEEHRAKQPQVAPVTEQVKRALRAALTQDDAQLEGVAKRLGLTGRSLQRRLREEDTAFQTVREAMRRELADRYLGQGLSLSEISFLLGFSEPSAFFRAFKRWTGVTPLERRASLVEAG